jgi:hypothetical protein
MEIVLQGNIFELSRLVMVFAVLRKAKLRPSASAALARKGIASPSMVTSAAPRAPAEAIPSELGLRPRHLRAVALRPPSEPPCGQRFLIATAAQQPSKAGKSFSTACQPAVAIVQQPCVGDRWSAREKRLMPSIPAPSLQQGSGRRRAGFAAGARLRPQYGRVRGMDY